MSDKTHQRKKGRGQSLKDYLPLVTIVVLSALAASALELSRATPTPPHSWMHGFMGFFLVTFSMFKFFDLPGFADGFQMYDLLAQRVRAYAYLYPFLELALGLGYLSHWQPSGVYLATVILMLWGTLGVVVALARKLDLECACMGTVLHVPLSTVALVEDLGMAGMAAFMLWASA